MGAKLRSFFDNKLPHRREDLDPCQLFIRILIKIIHLLVTGSFVAEFILFHIYPEGAWLDIFCFPKTRDGWFQEIIFYVYGVSALVDFIISFGHLLILVGLCNCLECLECFTCLKDVCPWSISRGKQNALGVFCALWIEKVSMDCGSSDSGVWGYILWIPKGLAFLNLLVSFFKDFPGRKCLKQFIRKLDAFVQAGGLIISIVLWFSKFSNDLKPTLWILLFWWILRTLQPICTEICKCISGKVKGDPQRQQATQRNNELSFLNHGSSIYQGVNYKY